MLIFGSEVNIYKLYIILFLCIAINLLKFFFHISDSLKTSEIWSLIQRFSVLIFTYILKRNKYVKYKKRKFI